VNLDPWDVGVSADDGQREALKQGEIDMDVERGGLERGEAIGHGGERLAYRVEVVERLAEPEVGHPARERAQTPDARAFANPITCDDPQNGAPRQRKRASGITSAPLRKSWDQGTDGLK